MNLYSSAFVLFLRLFSLDFSRFFLRYIEIFRSSSSECRRSTIFNNGGGGGGNGNGNGNGNGPRNNGGGGGLGGGFNNDRGMGRGQRNNRTNFRGESKVVEDLDGSSKILFRSPVPWI